MYNRHTELALQYLLYLFLGDSANAVPNYQKLRTRLTHIWGDRRVQPNRSAMEGPRPGETSFMIEVFSVPGKYEIFNLHAVLELIYAVFSKVCLELFYFVIIILFLSFIE